ncbi:hypothetical protein SLEP1_g58144 [Rubroshorea leprosula]|uniref:Mechanosensitive ion channel protein n=1 Tax=Rubroshorea leprosula TaxID=152421 RepID=A0AAV5MPG7_9ROSI|nr:hypothetical protein SLEP1_g58144 [Rubroshorea leprosula]
MAEKNGGEQLDDLETGNTEVGSSSKNAEITKESPSTSTVPPPTSVNKDTIPHENSKAKGEIKDGTGNCATTTKSKICSGFLFVILTVPFLLVYVLISSACLIVRAIVAPKKWTIWVVLEWIALASFNGFLIASLTKQNLKNHLIWELELWKWCILLMVVVCGKLISQWIVNAVFLPISLFFADNLKVYCFAYGLKQKNRVFVWWGLVLIAWLALVVRFGNGGGTRSEETKMILDYVTRVLASLLIGGGLWLGKDLLLWSIAVSFQNKNFFERILRAKFYKYVIETLVDGRSVRMNYIKRYGFINWAEGTQGRTKSAFSIKLFLDVMGDDYKLKPKFKPKPNLDSGKKDQEKKNYADTYAALIWDNLLAHKREGKSGTAGPSQSSDRSGSEEGKTFPREVFSELIPDDESLKQMFYLLLKGHKNSDPNKNKVVAMLFQFASKEMPRPHVGRGELRSWMESVYKECNSLKSSLKSTRRGMEELNKLAKGIVIILIVIVWLLMMKVVSTQAVVLILSQFFVLTFVFGDTCKRIFEGIMFVFVIHPFEIGDRCLIEGREEEVFVKKINIQTTVFSRVEPTPNDNKDDGDDHDKNEQIVYPNSVLAAKHICKFRSHDSNPPPALPSTPPKFDMTDSVEFVVDASTSRKQIEALDSRLRGEIAEEVPSAKISVHANGFEDGDKIKMGVYITYIKLWEDNKQKSEWKSKIVLGLKQILEDMGISKYHKKINAESAAAAISPAVV